MRISDASSKAIKLYQDYVKRRSKSYTLRVLAISDKFINLYHGYI